MNIEKSLEAFGLTKNKAVVYIALLQIGTGSAHQIAQKARLPRTTVHEILQHLLLLGLASFASKGRTRVYSAEHPEKLKKLLLEKEKKLEAVLPELVSMLNVKGVRPRVRFYEGVEGVKHVFEDTLTTRHPPLCSILSMADLYVMPGKVFMDHYVQQRIATGIKLHVIRSEVKDVAETWPSSTREFRELHYAAKEMLFPMTIYLYDNKVGIIGTEKENFGMIIESQEFYQTLKNLFDVLWQVTRVGRRVD